MRDELVEQAVRESLERQALDADVDVPVVERARAAADGGPSAGRLLLVAAAVIAVVAGGVAIAQTRSGGDVADPTRPKPTPTAAADIPITWRTEAWHGAEVKVPPEWGWGGAPVEEMLNCDSGPARAADGSSVELSDPVPYVGRSVMLSDACTMMSRRTRPDPDAPYVWLGAPLPAGKVQMGKYVEETVEVGGTTVTVATDDPELRAQILSTARPVGADVECRPSTDEIIEAAGPGSTEGLGAVLGASMCAYKKDGDGWSLAAAQTLTPAAGQRFQRAVAKAPAAPLCKDDDVHEFVTVHLTGEDQFSSDHRKLDAVYVVKLGVCSGVALDSLGNDATANRLTRANVQSWAVGPVPVTLTGPTHYDPQLAKFFIGMLG